MMNRILLSTILIAAIAVAESCKSTEKESMKNAKGIASESWGETDGKQVYLFTLTNSKGNQVKITNYGATVTSWIVPDKEGKMANIVLGFDSLKNYLAGTPYFGAIVGRYGNRIAKGQFTLNGSTYTLATNDGPNHLHGGVKGFDKVVWDAEADSTGNTLTLRYLSKDGEEGYPGNLTSIVRYTLNDDDELVIEYELETDKPTPVNLTNHAYFNLTGDVSNTILDHLLTIHADEYTPVDATAIPTGEITAVAGTPFDFTSPQRIGARIDQVPGGYDHNYVLRSGDGLKLAAVLYDSVSGRNIDTYTTEPGIQFYSGNFLDGSLTLPSGKPIARRTALCLETQHFPDSPNQPSFPTAILNPGEKYTSTTKYTFSVKK